MENIKSTVQLLKRISPIYIQVSRTHQISSAVALYHSNSGCFGILGVKTPKNLISCSSDSFISPKVSLALQVKLQAPPSIGITFLITFSESLLRASGDVSFRFSHYKTQTGQGIMKAEPPGNDKSKPNHLL